MPKTKDDTEEKTEDRELEAEENTQELPEFDPEQAGDNPMESVYESSISRPEPGEIVEGEVVAVDTASVYIDLPPHSTGIIFGREYINARLPAHLRRRCPG